jgi:hypothetical protein
MDFTRLGRGTATGGPEPVNQKWLFPHKGALLLFLKTLEMAYGRKMNMQFSGNSSGGHSCSQHANCTLSQNWHICGIVLCSQHLCNDHAVYLASLYATPDRWMDCLGKGEMLTYRDVNKFEHNILEKKTLHVAFIVLFNIYNGENKYFLLFLKQKSRKSHCMIFK